MVFSIQFGHICLEILNVSIIFPWEFKYNEKKLNFLI